MSWNPFHKLFFKRKFQIDVRKFDWQNMDKQKFDIHYNGLFNRKPDVLILQNFLTRAEVQTLQTDVSNLDSSEFTHHGNRYRSIPPVFEYLIASENPDYFKDCKENMRFLQEHLSISLEKRIFDLFEFLCNGELKVDTPRLDSTQVYPFPSGSLRIIPQTYGEIKIHADNNFYGNNPIFDEFKEKVNLSNHISYILHIQKSEAGGNLVLYDIDYNIYNHHKGDCVIDKSGVEKKITDFTFFECKLDEGDLVLFSGGQIWHSVNRMHGLKDRITYGGFSVLGTNNDKIYLWT